MGRAVTIKRSTTSARRPYVPGVENGRNIIMTFSAVAAFTHMV